MKTRLIVASVNWLVIVGCIGLTIGLVYPHLRSRRTPVSLTGTRLDLPAVGWRGRTVVLAMSTHCHYCTASASFYKKLLSVADSRGVQVVAVLPQPTSESRAYLAGLQLPISTVEQFPLNKLNVSATPTLFMVNSTGLVTESWVGQLPHSTEQQVLAKL